MTRKKFVRLLDLARDTHGINFSMDQAKKGVTVAFEGVWNDEVAFHLYQELVKMMDELITHEYGSVSLSCVRKQNEKERAIIKMHQTVIKVISFEDD